MKALFSLVWHTEMSSVFGMDQSMNYKYGLKASQMSKVCASSHKYPHIEKSRIFGNRISKVRWPTTVMAKELTARQKDKPHGKKNNYDLTAKEIRIKMSSRYRRNFAVSLFLFAVRFSFCFKSFSFCREVFLFAASLFLFAAWWGYSFCCEVFLFAVRLMLLPWQLWATVLRWGKQQAIG